MEKENEEINMLKIEMEKEKEMINQMAYQDKIRNVNAILKVQEFENHKFRASSLAGPSCNLYPDYGGQMKMNR